MELHNVTEKIIFTWDDFLQNLMGLLPNLGIAIVTIGLGLLLAYVVKKITYKLLKKFKLDCAAERIGLTDALKKSGFQKTPSMLVATLLFWLIVIFSFITTADAIGLTGFSETLTTIALYIPKLIAAIVIIVAGLLLAHFARLTTKATLSHFVPAISSMIATLVYGLIVVVIALTALEQLAIDTYLIQMVVLIAFGAFAAAITLSLGLGSRHQIRKLLAGYYIKDHVKIDQTITVGGQTGRIIALHADNVILETPQGQLIIPNDLWQDSQILIHSEK